MAKTIRITTTQKVVIEYELAPLRDRILAWLIDFIIIFFGSILILIAHSLIGQNMVIMLISLLFFFYTLASEILMDGQTLGKKVLSTKVVKISGREATIGDYLIRWSFRIIDIYFTLGGVAAMLISSSPNNQRLGGRLSHTTVIKLRPSLRVSLRDVLAINESQPHEITYPQVRRLAEKDMLLIKNVLDRTRKYNNPAHRAAMTELVERIRQESGITPKESDPAQFIEKLIWDYVVLTR
ncbi:MAG: RDD family protein [Bacteroidia bacterium]